MTTTAHFPLRILFLTAYFPPCERGWGYMRLCEQIADGLYERGHAVEILTSQYQDGDEIKPYRVHRKLTIDPDWTIKKPVTWQFYVGRRQRDAQAVSILTEIKTTFDPHIIFIWHGHGLSRALFWAAENMPGSTAVYYLANYLPEMPDEYLRYWQAPPTTPLSYLLKRPFAKHALHRLAAEGKPLPLTYQNSVTVSQYVRKRLVDAQLIPESAQAIPNGIDLAMFQGQVRKIDQKKQPIRCLTAGRLDPKKGFHTVIRAFAQLKMQGQLKHIECTIMGSGLETYEQQLRQQVTEAQLERVIHFRPPVSIDDWPSILGEYDIFILPSEWSEPLASIMLEAMANGMLMISTPTGGSSEVLHHEQTGLAFDPGDVEGLAQQLVRIQTDPQCIETLAKEGQQLIFKEYGIQTAVSRIESYLVERVSLNKVEA